MGCGASKYKEAAKPTTEAAEPAPGAPPAAPVSEATKVEEAPSKGKETPAEAPKAEQTAEVTKTQEPPPRRHFGLLDDPQAVHALVPTGLNEKYQIPENPDGTNPLLCVTLAYDFASYEDRHAFVVKYVEGSGDSDSIFSTVTLAAQGLKVGKVLKGIVAEHQISEKILEYQEWDSQESFKNWLSSMIEADDSLWKQSLGIESSSEETPTINIDDLVANPNTPNCKFTKLKDQKLLHTATHTWSLLAKADRSGDRELFPDPQPGYCCSIVYEWKEISHYHDWLQNFCQGDDGHVTTAESEGCRMANLLVARGTDDVSTIKTGFYEEWDSQKLQFAYAGVRVRAGFMQHYFDLDLKTFAWPKLVGENSHIMGWELMKKGPWRARDRTLS